MKNSYLIRNLGPNLLQDHSHKEKPEFVRILSHSALFWAVLLGLLSWIGYGVVHAGSAGSDPMVMKVYPDGTKLLVRWSDIGSSFDDGKNFGGAPKIIPYDPAKDGIVPIGQSSRQSKSTATNPPLPASTSVVNPDQPATTTSASPGSPGEPAKMDYSQADPKDFEDPFGPREGFVLRSAVGVAFQQSLSGRSANVGNDYLKYVFAPGIRYDLEANYNVTDWFRTGLETAFVYNQIHSVSVDNDTAYNNSPGLGNGGLFQVPVLYTATFHFPSDGPFQGYLGGGVGADWNVFQLSLDSGNSPLTYTSYHWNWAYQLTAGFTYAVAPGLDLDVAYKMLSMTNPNFADSGQFKPSYNHTAEIGLVWRF